MNPANVDPVEHRVLVMAPTRRDVSLTHAVFQRAGVASQGCRDINELVEQLQHGAAAAMLPESVLANNQIDPLIAWLEAQPPWSDLPLLLLARANSNPALIEEVMSRLGNVTVLERPVRMAALLSAVRTALRARQRQYQTREHILQRERTGERMRLLWKAAAVLLSTDEPDRMMRLLFDEIAPHMKLDACLNYMVDDRGEFLRLESCAGISPEVQNTIREMKFGQTPCGVVAQRATPVVLNHIQDSDDPLAHLLKECGVRAYACNPLMARDRLLGTLAFATRAKDSFQPEELEFLEIVSRYVTASYERLQLILKLREADRRKDEFLATLSHELRNPLSPIVSALETMRRSDDPQLVPENRAIIERQVEHMVRLVDDLLDISRIMRGKLRLHRTQLELAAVLQQALETCRPMLNEHSHRLTVDLPPEPIRLPGDPVRLAQVFSNLINNACKYMERGGLMEIAARTSGESVVVSVKDHGIGIPPSRLSEIFELFAQVPGNLERSEGGLGIGLTLVRRLVELHDGQVRAFSEGLGKGSEFSVTLPMDSKAPEHPVEAPAPAAPRTAPRRILVVDDHPDSARSLARLLSLSGDQTWTAHDGLEALKAAEELKPDIVLMDIGLPHMNGHDVCREIRQQPWGKNMTLIALTGWGQKQDLDRSREAGFNSHLVKPVDVAALTQLLGECHHTGVG